MHNLKLSKTFAQQHRSMQIEIFTCFSECVNQNTVSIPTITISSNNVLKNVTMTLTRGDLYPS